MKRLFSFRTLLLTMLGLVFLNNQEPDVSYSYRCNMPTHPDYAPLMALFNSTDGPNWTKNDGWGVDCNVCGWEGIFCNDNRVHIIQLISNNLTGTIPSELVDLDSLITLRLPRNNLVGTIPASFTNFQKLQSVELFRNSLSNEFPTALFDIPSLVAIRLSSNEFSGELQDNFANLQSLEIFEVGQNNFSGVLPLSLYELQSLKQLSLNSNSFSGGISSSIQGLSSIEVIRMQYNQFVGNISNAVGTLDNLIEMNLSYNFLSGELPIEIYDLNSLRNLNISNNNLSGNIVNEIGQLNSLERLNLSSNLFSGTLPLGIGQLSSLLDINLGINDFEGQIPSSFYDLSNLQNCDLRSNNFSGMLDAGIGNLSSLKLLNITSNNFTGIFPNEIGNCQELATLFAYSNNFAGQLPESLGLLPKINRVSLFNNKFTDCYPQSYVNLCDIFSISLHSNCFFENPSFNEFCSGIQCDNSLNISASSDVVCEGESVSITAPGGYSEYNWSESNSENASNVINPQASAYHYITITNSKGCTKTDSVYIEVNPSPVGNELAYLCEGSSVFVNGVEYISSGQETQLIPRQGLCDSILNIEILLVYPSYESIQASICPGDFLQINGQDLGPGNHTQILNNQSGCDSTISITIDEIPISTTYLEFDVCENATYNYQGTEYGVGSHILNFTAANSCDSIVNIEIYQQEHSNGEISASKCVGTPITINDVTYISDGEYEQVLTNNSGCDSILTLTIVETGPTFSTITGEFCEGNGYYINLETFYTEGPHEQTMVNSNGCDSIITINLTELANTENYLNYSLCPGQEVEVNNQIFNIPGEYLQQNINNAGCDSNIYIIIENVEPKDTSLNGFICDGGTFTAGGTSFNSSGNYLIEISTVAGCDSFIYLNLSTISGRDTTINATTCEGESYLFAGNNLFNAGTYSDSIIIGDCKALTTLVLEVIEPKHVEVDKIICEGERFYLDGYFYDEEGVYETTLTNTQGCDSTVAYNLRIAPEYETRIDRFICEGETVYYDFQIYDHPGTFEKTKQSISGCDSIVILSIEAYETEVKYFAYEVCSGDSIDFEGINYSVGVHLGEFHDGNCDQSFELEIAEVEELPLSITHELCVSGQIEIFGETFSNAGQYWIGKSNGECEFVEYLNIIGSSNEDQLNMAFICEGSSIEIGKNTYNVSGQYVTNPLDSECGESNVLVLEVVNGEALYITKTLELGTSIEIEGNIYTEAGDYEILVGELATCPTLIHLNIIFEECGGERSLDVSMCEGDSYDFFGQSIDEEGQYVYEKALIIECDSLINLNITFESVPSFEIAGQQLICPSETISLSGPAGYSYVWNTGSSEQVIEISQSGTYAVTISDQIGCSNSSIIAVDAFELPTSAPKISKISPSECDSEDGRILIELENEANYLYSLDGIVWQESPLFAGLMNGFYPVLLADNSVECTVILSDGIELASEGVPIIQELAVTEVNGCQGILGSLKIIAAKPNPDLVYSIDGGTSWQSEPVFENLEPGIYNVQMKKDGSVCVNNLTGPIVLVNIGNLEVEAIIENEVSCTSSSDGQVRVNIINGQAPFNYFWPSGNNEEIGSNLLAGNYIVTISDANDCIVEVSFELDAADLAEITTNFIDTTICVGDLIQYENLNADYSFYVFVNDELYAEGNSFEISEAGIYNIIIENGSDCYEEKEIIVDYIDLEDSGIDFLLSSKGVVNVPVELVNISDPMPEFGYWEIANNNIEVQKINRFANTLTFKEIGEYEITYLAEINGCLGSIRKTIIIYGDSTYIDNEIAEVEIAASRVEKFIIFPNPNDGNFQVDIQLSNMLDCKLSIYNSLGGLIERRNLRGDSEYSENFNLSTTNSGVYSVFLNVNGKLFKQQILILK